MKEATLPILCCDLSSTDIQVPAWVGNDLVEQVRREIASSGKEIVTGRSGIELSVVIPTRSGRPQTTALRSVLACGHKDGESAEIILALGDQPSIQRNVALSLARGRLVGFLDDDCQVPTDWMTRAMGIFDSREVGMLGGPNLTPENSSFFSKCVGRVLSSRWGTAMMRARYSAVGQETRLSGDERAALCNMVFDRSIFAGSGFDERLFPNEENELIVRLTRAGHRLLYDPAFGISHPRKDGLLSFAKQFFGYGSGRAWQTKIQPGSLRPIHLMPTFTLLGFMALPFTAALGVGPPAVAFLLGALLFIYFALVGTASASVGVEMRSVKAFLLSMVLYPTLHFSYGLGFLARILTPRGRKRTPSSRTWMLRLTVRAAGH